ncbi:type VI secretion system baseplate subunit TssK [Andreprevotia chitinilytica]|uniref:type VI secretion system baseplate subunit TssK n=1 Tax=Andreprevotia chitinilytica TaxID=396808 RepID=UPI00055706B1|nr:type VI secretion system baseplate subunit TssK [Andreprevotia chitinilytica]
MKSHNPVPAMAAALRQRVVWSEGMFLRPHHFQQLERYFEHYVQARSLPLQGFHWGWHRLELDRAALALGRIVLQGGAGVLPDGTPFSFDADDAPAALEIPAELKEQTIVLALPLWRAGTDELGDGEGQQWTRYTVTDFEIEDANAASFGPAVLQAGRLDLRLLPESAMNGDWQALGVLHVLERRNDGLVLLDDGYIPPLLSATRHPVLRGYLDELHGLLQQRGDVLAERLSQPGRGGVGEVADFLMLELINRYTAVTWQAQQAACQHPMQLFGDWLKLACDLATHTAERRRPGVLPEYRHDALRTTFAPLMAELRRALSTVLEQHAIPIPLQERGNGVRVAQIPSLELIQQAGFVLAVNADMPADVLRTRFPAQLKMGAVERIRDLVLLQLPGIALRLLPVAPRQLPYHAGYTYFELEKSGEFWKQLEKSGGLALHVAGDFPGLTMEFWAVRE